MHSSKDLLNWVESYLESLDPGAKLPGDPEFAGRFGVSPRTVRRVMDSLRDRGLVQRIPGKGTFKTAETSLVADLPSPGKAPEVELAEELVAAISRGDFRRGSSLPLVKTLSMQHNLGRNTVTRTYQILQSRGIVGKIGKRFWVGGVTPLTRQPVRHEAWLVSDREERLADVFVDPLLGRAFQKFEAELRSCGVLLRFAGYEKLRRHIAGWRKDGAYPVGILFWSCDGWRQEELRDLLTPLVLRGNELKTRVVVDLTQPGTIHSFPYRVHLFSQGHMTTERGRSIAEYLARSDYQRVVMVMDGKAVEGSSRVAFLRYYKVIYEILAEGHYKGEISQAILTGDWDMTPERFIAHILDTDQRYIEYLTGKYARTTHRSVQELFDGLHMVPSASDLARLPGTPALWICATDAVAQRAVSEIDNADARVPKDISVLALDNTPQFQHRGFSYCAHDRDLIGYLLAHTLVGDFTVPKSTHGYIDVPCPVVHRLTTKYR